MSQVRAFRITGNFQLSARFENLTLSREKKPGRAYPYQRGNLFQLKNKSFVCSETRGREHFEVATHAEYPINSRKSRFDASFIKKSSSQRECPGSIVSEKYGYGYVEKKFFCALLCTMSRNFKLFKGQFSRVHFGN